MKPISRFIRTGAAQEVKIAVDQGTQEGVAARQLEQYSRLVPGAEWFDTDRRNENREYSTT